VLLVFQGREGKGGNVYKSVALLSSSKLLYFSVFSTRWCSGRRRGEKRKRKKEEEKSQLIAGLRHDYRG